ncbi:hypothetical protein BLNAU_9622 [Blattamonas nauphoetae]|uniref:Uncharacterized protein n=1 Tax=Blattamonas nauphoetae TaxID=2049346 RepID=A0ABQ9XV89_9EUKA|nr:hypothetical protein BLNAU_9622 [Blattamonas nauphoetae]
MIALVEHFVASGDLILPNSSPPDHFQYFTEYYHQLDRNDDQSSDPFLLHNLAASFTRFVLQSNRRSSFILPDGSFLHGDDVEYSEELLDAVKKVKEKHSMQAVRNTYSAWTEWMKMMETIEKDATLGTDLSFLLSRCLRSTLLSLQSKHLLITDPLQNEENTETESSSNKNHTHPPSLPFQPNATLNGTDASSLTSSTSISTQLSLPSERSSFDSHILASDQLVFPSDSIVHHSRQILSAIHLHLTRPHHTSFPWDIYHPNNAESILDAHLQPSPQFVDQNAKFDISLFDEPDDQKFVASLRRCLAVLEATESTECIVDVDTFRTFLVSALNSSSLAIPFECHTLFFIIADFLPTVDDPREDRFLSFRTAFRDGTYWEKMTLLHLWIRWFQFTSMGGHGQMMVESDFDFDGLLAADLSDTHHFDDACVFVGCVFSFDAVSMSFEWRMDFLLSFEKRHQMMSRLSCDPSPSYNQEQFQLYHGTLAPFLGTLLSLFRGYDFPSALTERVTIDSSFSPHNYRFGAIPAFFLSHASIAPRHRHSFFPMDLMFERCIRWDPDAFFTVLPAPSVRTPRRFLFTPYVGLHSLLHRCPKLNLNQESLDNLARMLVLNWSGQDTTQDDIYRLFFHFPPPRLLDTLLSSPNFVRATTIHWCVTCFGFGTAPFGACASLSQVFKMLAPFNSKPEQEELDSLSKAGETVVSLHWLSIPSHFDSPLLCHLPSLAGSQRGVLQTLSSHSGIPSLVAPQPAELYKTTIRRMMAEDILHSRIDILSLCVCSLASGDFCSPSIALLVLDFFNDLVLSPFPAIVSVAVEFFHRFDSVSSDAIRIELLKKGLMDRVVFTVSNSSFLDDYEKGIAVIGILLGTIRRSDQKQRMRVLNNNDIFTMVPSAVQDSITQSSSTDPSIEPLSSDVPAGVSVALEFLTRFVRMSSDGVGVVWSVGCCGCVGVFVVVFGGLRKRSGSDWDSARDNATSGAEHADTSIQLLLLFLTSSLSIRIDCLQLDEPVWPIDGIGNERHPLNQLLIHLEDQSPKVDGDFRRSD